MLVIISIFLLTFGPGETIVNTFFINIKVPVISTASYAVYFFGFITSLLPIEQEIVSITPFSGFLSQVLLSFFMSFVITLPFFLLSIIKYLWPALYIRERKQILILAISALTLFVLGAFFATFFLVTPAFRFLEVYSTNIGSVMLLDSYQLVTIFIMLVATVALMFLTPIIMVLATLLRITPARFWVKNWRIIISVIVIFSAIITPDGSGITMLILALPLGLLYCIGLFISLRIQKK